MGDGFGVLDIAVLAVVLLSALLALMRGFVHEVLSFSAWIGAAIVTVFAFPYVQPFARRIVDISILADIASGIAVFLISLVLLTIFAKLLAELVQGSSLSAIDRVLGLGFGVLRGAALVCLAWLIFAWMVPETQRPDWIRTARTLPYLQQGASWLQELLPRSFLTSLGETAKRNIEQEAGEVMNPSSSQPESAPANTTESANEPAPQPSVAPAEESQEPAYDESSRESLEDAIKNLPADGSLSPSEGSQ
ncbi:MAG: CvpA family protein [Kiloniellales bacterium]